MVLRTQSPSETFRLGKALGRLLPPGSVVALVGDLGSGKTQFIKGLAAGVGVPTPAYVSSPTFTLIHEYAGALPFYHVDLYRLSGEKEAEALGLEECFQGPGITAVEWADKIPSLLPDEALWIHLQDKGGKHRSFEIRPRGKRFEEVIQKLSARCHAPT